MSKLYFMVEVETGPKDVLEPDGTPRHWLAAEGGQFPTQEAYEKYVADEAVMAISEIGATWEVKVMRLTHDHGFAAAFDPREPEQVP